jgi:hypothetical protein
MQETLMQGYLAELDTYKTNKINKPMLVPRTYKLNH